MFDLKSILNQLPNKEKVLLRTEADCYGISRLISKKINLPFTPVSYSPWSHGWTFVDLKYLESFGLISNHKYLVHNKVQEAFVKSFGKKAFAVGSPYIYASSFEKNKIKRLKKSLLIMPPHTAPFLNESAYHT